MSKPMMKPKKGFALDQAEEVCLHEADLKLIRLIRSIGSGQIENLEIRNGSPVYYKSAWKSGKLI